MSDRFYGHVEFPVWATRYLPDLFEEPYTGDLKVLRIADEEAKDGYPWAAYDLEKLGIPHDVESAEYFECRAKKTWFRFTPDGKTVEKVMSDGDSDIDARNVLKMLENGHYDLLVSDLERLAKNSDPLGPSLGEITLDAYEFWLNQKARVFRENVRVIAEGRLSVGDAYMYTPPEPDPQGKLFGVSGSLLVREVPQGLLVDDLKLDQADRDFGGSVWFFYPETSRRKVAAFIVGGRATSNHENEWIESCVRSRLDLLCSR